MHKLLLDSSTDVMKRVDGAILAGDEVHCIRSHCICRLR